MNNEFESKLNLKPEVLNRNELEKEIEMFIENQLDEYLKEIGKTWQKSSKEERTTFLYHIYESYESSKHQYGFCVICSDALYFTAMGLSKIKDRDKVIKAHTKNIMRYSHRDENDNRNSLERAIKFLDKTL